MSVATDTQSASQRSRVQARNETKPVPPPVWVGTKLHEARERVGISLRQIADTTKLSVSTLMALERNEFSRLPGGVFARGYVRSFASEVGLDAEAIVAEFVEQAPIDSVKDGYGGAEAAAKAEAAATKEDAVEAPRVEAPIAHGKWMSDRNLLWFSGVGFVLGVIGVVFVTTAAYVTSSNRTPRAQSKPSLSDVTGTTGLATTKPARPGARDKNAPTTAAVTAPAASVARALDGDIKLPSSDATKKVARAKDVAAAKEIAPTKEVAPAKEVASPAEPAAAAPAAAPAADRMTGEQAAAIALAAKRLAVKLSVNRASWVIAIVDGKKAISRQLEVGEEETLTARQNLVVTTGDAEAIVMTINGAAIKTLGEGGEAVTVRINRRNLSDYLR